MLNCYEQIVCRLTERQSTRSIANWLMTLNLEPPAGKWSERYWRKLLGPLAAQVKAAVGSLEVAEPATAVETERSSYVDLFTGGEAVTIRKERHKRQPFLALFSLLVLLSS